jgi:heme/copper-type cytochrome/quinol oxidase subunit 3
MSDELAHPRASIDVSALPTTVFGPRGVTWWATVAFMAIEGTTLAGAVAAYIYLRRNFPDWPPAPTPRPDLLLPTINALVLLSVIIPMRVAAGAARRFDLRRVRVGLLIALLLSAVAVALRIADFSALNTRWDTDAYGSVAWIVVGLHSTLLIVDLIESAVITQITFSSRLQPHHFSDVEDAAIYQYFLSLIWLPLYALVYLSPWII